MRFKLANIIFDAGDFLAGHEDLLYRVGGTAGTVRVEDGQLAFAGIVDLLTYFNALSLAKWRRYTSLENVSLHLELLGSDCDILIQRANARAEVDTEVATNMYESASWQAFDLPLYLPEDENDAVLVGAKLASAGITLVRNAYFYTNVEPDRVRPIRLALATTTFNNEDYIAANIELVRNEVLASGEPIADACHMFVVDNGRTLDAQALSGNGISVLPNPNVGGSGGFARGMLEAIGEGTSGAHETPFTHVLLMDDDIRVFPESFIRTFNLLSLANDAYANAFVQGAMLKLQEPNIQYEDVSYVKRTSGYDRMKPTFDVSELASVVENETMPVERDHAYGAWWYCCVPLSAVRSRGLPLPLFIRIDDVEYGAREQSTYMTLGGICAWHSQFLGRFRASVDLYQYGRNMLVSMATSNIADMRAFMAKYWRNFQVYLRNMAYENAELWLDALEDYLRGPSWLAQVDGAQKMKDNAQKNEKLVPLDQLDLDVVEAALFDPAWIGHEQPPQNPVRLALEALPYDRHYLPDFLLEDQPAVVDYSGTLSPWWATARRKTLVALDATADNGHIRTLDRERHKALMQRFQRLARLYRTQGDHIAQDYRDALPYLSSVEFWKNYLGISQ